MRRQQTRQRRVLTVAAAAAAPAVVWAVARAAGTDLTVAMSGRDPMAITLPIVIGTAVLAAAVGWGLLAVLERLTSRAGAWWSAIALAVLVASFGAPMTVDAAGGTRAILVLMHVAVAAVLVPGLRATAGNGAALANATAPAAAGPTR